MKFIEIETSKHGKILLNMKLIECIIFRGNEIDLYEIIIKTNYETYNLGCGNDREWAIARYNQIKEGLLKGD